MAVPPAPRLSGREPHGRDLRSRRTPGGATSARAVKHRGAARTVVSATLRFGIAAAILVYMGMSGAIDWRAASGYRTLARLRALYVIGGGVNLLWNYDWSTYSWTCS